MNIQEREEMEHGDGHTNELSRLLEQSRGENPVPKVNKTYVAWLSSLGFYVVISYADLFCKWTDAPLGRGEYIDAITRNPEEVEELKEWFEFYGEPYTIVPPEPQGGR
jgi:hypothetical protein